MNSNQIKINDYIFTVERPNNFSLESKTAVYFRHCMAGEAKLEKEDIDLKWKPTASSEIELKMSVPKYYSKDVYAVEVPSEVIHPIFGNINVSELSNRDLIFLAIGSDVAERRHRR